MDDEQPRINTDEYGELHPHRVVVFKEPEFSHYKWGIWRGLVREDVRATHAEAIAYAQKIAAQA